MYDFWNHISMCLIIIVKRVMKCGVQNFMKSYYRNTQTAWGKVQSSVPRGGDTSADHKWLLCAIQIGVKKYYRLSLHLSKYYPSPSKLVINMVAVFTGHTHRIYGLTKNFPTYACRKHWTYNMVWKYLNFWDMPVIYKIQHTDFLKLEDFKGISCMLLLHLYLKLFL